MLEKAATIKRFEYSPFGKESKAQTEISKKQYQILQKNFEYNEKIKKKKKTAMLKSIVNQI